MIPVRDHIHIAQCSGVNELNDDAITRDCNIIAFYHFLFSFSFSFAGFVFCASSASELVSEWVRREGRREGFPLRCSFFVRFFAFGCR